MVNKLYNFLDDAKWLKEQRLLKSRSQLAKELSEKTGYKKNNLMGSMRFRELKWYTKEELKSFKQERAFHTNKKRKAKGKV